MIAAYSGSLNRWLVLNLGYKGTGSEKLAATIQFEITVERGADLLAGAPKGCTERDAKQGCDLHP